MVRFFDPLRARRLSGALLQRSRTYHPSSEAPVSHTVSPDVHRILTDAVTAIRSGDKARGRTLLAQALRIDPRNETAWLGMASVAETPERRRECLERALTINPNSQIARRALQKLSDSQPSRAPHDASAPDQASRSSSSSAPIHAQTVTQEGEAPQDQARHCPQCGAPIGATDTVCAFCKSPLAPPSSASDTLSYPKRTPLTREEQRRLTGQSLKRICVPRLFNATTIVGIVITCIAGAIIAWTIQQNWTAHPGALFLSLLLPSLFLVPGIINIIQGMQMYRFARSLRNATAVAEAPVLDVWQYEGFEGEPFVVAWELTVIDRYGRTIRYRQAQKIGKELHDYLQTRATVQVRYTPDQPDIAMLDEQWVAAIKGASST
ncbi:hypothetical protein RoseRS_0044 [Roseiflexus sp. RS-1]|nr:hypothetical protein RoseRS_0044 [Roseiflexus sp. RS-1]